MTDALDREGGGRHNWLAVTAPQDDFAEKYVYLGVGGSQMSWTPFGVPMRESRALKIIAKIEKIHELDFLEFGIIAMSGGHRHIVERGKSLDRQSDEFEATVQETLAKKKRAEAIVEAEDRKAKANGKPARKGKVKP